MVTKGIKESIQTIPTFFGNKLQSFMSKKVVSKPISTDTIESADNSLPKTPKIKPIDQTIKPKGNEVGAPPIVNPYYTDTLTKAGDEMPKITASEKSAAVDAKKESKSKLDEVSDEVSQWIEEELKKQNKDFQKLQTMIYKIVMMQMRKAAKVDQSFITEMGIDIKAQAIKIQQTYNQWTGVTITVISAVVSVAGGFCGLAPLAPFISQGTAATLGASSVAISQSGTGLGSLSSIFNSRSEGQRQVLNVDLERTRTKEEGRKGSKHEKVDLIKSARAANDEHNRLANQANESMLRTN